MKILNIQIPDKTHKHRHFCVKFDESYILHKNPNGDHIKSEWIQAWSGGKKIELETKDNEKAGRYDLMQGEEDIRTYYDQKIEGTGFLLYDNAGLNYAHFFFDFFGRCLYFDELRKIIPNIKLLIPEDYYTTEGNSDFIKQWLDLYYEEEDFEIIILQKGLTYKIDNLVISNILYGFPEPMGDSYIIEKIRQVVTKIPAREVITRGVYISRQDTIKRGWYHGRELENELELIKLIKTVLGYDIVELMDYTLRDKISIFKSYETIIQQSSASNVNILFTGKNTNNVIISNPRIGPWMNYKLQQYSTMVGCNLFTIDEAGELTSHDHTIADINNLPWRLTDVHGVVELIASINNL